MTQLPLPLPPFKRRYRPLKGPSCPACKQKLRSQKARLTVWQSFREWLQLNWDWVARQLVLHLAHRPEGLSLAEHPDLLLFLTYDAGAHGLEVNDRLAEIIDGYVQGEFDAIKRRGKKLVLSQTAESEDGE